MNGNQPVNLDPYEKNLTTLTDATMKIVSVSTGLLSTCKLYAEQYQAMYQRLKEAGIDWDTDPANPLSEGNVNRQKLREAAAQMKRKRGKGNA